MLQPRRSLLASHGTIGAGAADGAALALASPGATLFHLTVVPDFWRGMMGDDWIEHSGGLGPQVIQKTKQSGEDWVGDWWITTTVGPPENGRGRIVGGTGEFADIRGEFVEIDNLTRFTVDGRMELDLELRLFIK